jgi:hypothetical protein
MSSKSVFKFHVVLFNGPPRVGKDTMAMYLQSIWEGSRHLKLSTPLKNAVRELFSYAFEDMEKYKDADSHRVFGKTIREHLISMSEDWVKVQYGKEAFGTLFAQRIMSLPLQTKGVICSDLGFMDELAPLVRALDANRITIVRLRQEGRTFEGDSRSYLDGEKFGIKCYDVENKIGEKEYAYLMIDGLLRRIVNG